MIDMKNRNKTNTLPRRSAGMTLLDILLAIVIFAVGMLALAQLQGSLSRSAGDSNARTVAANIGEEVIEALRLYENRSLAAGDVCPTDLPGMKTKKVFECVTAPSADWTFERGGVNYTVNLAVDDWFFKADRETLTNDKTDSDLSGRALGVPDFKEIEITVSWASAEFRVDESTTDTLGSGTFTASSIVPSIPVMGSARIAADDDGARGAPDVLYTPGAKPDVVAIQLDTNKFKESTTPMPDVIRRDEIVETWFDVITYNTNNAGAVFLRREEFAVVSCECELVVNDSTKSGFLPTAWNGYGYTEGEWVAKNYGTSANNQQSQYCDTCCRDHHDSASYTDNDDRYDPFGDWTETSGGVHKHWGRSNSGNMVEATKTGDKYVEACRMVRKDGFMRVAQDFRQEQLLVVPQSYFATDANISTYSKFVTDGVADYYAGLTTPGTGTFPAPPKMPGDATNNAIDLPTVLGSRSDQQVSRAVYIDHITTEAKAMIDCVKGGSAGDDCTPPAPNVDAGKYLEIFPFYEVQTTWLSFWRQAKIGSPVTVTSEPLETDNAHSRGLAALSGDGTDQAEVINTIHRGNIGLTSTDPITPDTLHQSGEWERTEYIDPNGGGGPPSDPNAYLFSGTITSFANKPRAADVIMGGNGVQCSKTATDFICAIDKGAVSPTLVITNYENKETPYWVCMTGADFGGLWETWLTGVPNETTFNLGGISSDMSGIALNIQDEPCP
jgi:type II secretory pathway pseudopilin PulG